MAGERDAKLLSVRLNMLVTGMTDPSRRARGRAYAVQGAVEDLVVLPGIVSAEVQGSRPKPYRVLVYVTEAASFETAAELLPERRDMRFSCSCPDDSNPCKHVVAVMVAFADLLIDEPSMLGLWRGEPQPGSGPRAQIGSRAGRPSAAPERTIDPVAVAALRAFLGEPQEHMAQPVSNLAPPIAAWGELWAEMLTDALDVMADEIIRPPLR